MIESIVTSALAIIAAIAPGALALATSQPDDEQAIASVLAAVRALPQREATDGDDAAGAWDADLAARKAGGQTGGA